MAALRAVAGPVMLLIALCGLALPREGHAAMGNLCKMDTPRIFGTICHYDNITYCECPPGTSCRDVDDFYTLPEDGSGVGECQGGPRLKSPEEEKDLGVVALGQPAPKPSAPENLFYISDSRGGTYAAGDKNLRASAVSPGVMRPDRLEQYMAILNATEVEVDDTCEMRDFPDGFYCWLQTREGIIWGSVSGVLLIGIMASLFVLAKRHREKQRQAESPVKSKSSRPGSPTTAYKEPEDKTFKSTVLEADEIFNALSNGLAGVARKSMKSRGSIMQDDEFRAIADKFGTTGRVKRVRSERTVHYTPKKAGGGDEPSVWLAGGEGLDVQQLKLDAHRRGSKHSAVRGLSSADGPQVWVRGGSATDAGTTAQYARPESADSELRPRKRSSSGLQHYVPEPGDDTWAVEVGALEGHGRGAAAEYGTSKRGPGSGGRASQYERPQSTHFRPDDDGGGDWACRAVELPEEHGAGNGVARYGDGTGRRSTRSARAPLPSPPHRPTHYVVSDMNGDEAWIETVGALKSAPRGPAHGEPQDIYDGPPGRHFRPETRGDDWRDAAAALEQHGGGNSGRPLSLSPPTSPPPNYQRPEDQTYVRPGDHRPEDWRDAEAALADHGARQSDEPPYHRPDSLGRYSGHLSIVSGGAWSAVGINPMHPMYGGDAVAMAGGAPIYEDDVGYIGLGGPEQLPAAVGGWERGSAMHLFDPSHDNFDGMSGYLDPHADMAGGAGMWQDPHAHAAAPGWDDYGAEDFEADMVLNEVGGMEGDPEVLYGEPEYMALGGGWNDEPEQAAAWTTVGDAEDNTNLRLRTLPTF